MAEIDLTQGEADALIALEKHRIDDKQIAFPMPGERLTIDLLSLDRKESFVLDVTRASIKLTKATFQTRARQAVVLLRLDIDGAPHRNPDGVEIPCPHIHIFRESYGDKWAFAASSQGFSDTTDLFGTLMAFMQRSNITLAPNIQPGLFS